MIIDKTHMLIMLQEEFTRWEDLLTSMTDEQITARQLPSQWTIKDVVAHLMVWQQRSIVRVEAALLNREPVFPGWPENLDPESEEDLEQVNAWIYETNQNRSWSSIHQDWKEGFLRFIEASKAVPENDLLDPQKFAWMEGQPLSLILFGWYEHHHDDHYKPLAAWLQSRTTQ